jgi:diguanylate cyclase (GGDEF)-like protein
LNTRDYAGILADNEEDIRACLANGRVFLRFPQTIECFFNAYDREKRQQRYIFLGICAIVLYDLYCIGDKIMLPDIYRTAWFTRLGIITPLMLLTILLVGVKRVTAFQDVFASLTVMTATFGVLYILKSSAHPNVEHYHTGILVIVMFGNIAVRLRFFYSLVSSVIIFVAYVHFSYHHSHMSIDMVHNSSLILLTTIIVSMIANYQMEKESRREYLLTVLQGIDSQKLSEANKKLELLSISDSLTGLSNRRYFDETLQVEWKSAIRSQYGISMIFLDIDNFKAYNDTYGHPAGDTCLKSIGHVIRESIHRPRDLAARYGGEEFVVLLPRTAETHALRMAQIIQEKVKTLDIEHRQSDNGERVTVSMGVACLFPSSGSQPEDLLKRADLGMYEAKQNGRNRIVLYRNEDASE